MGSLGEFGMVMDLTPLQLLYLPKVLLVNIDEVIQIEWFWF